MKRGMLLALLAPLCLVAGPAAASSNGVELKHIEVDHSPEARKRGAMTVIDVCNACHSLKYIRYRNLIEAGFTKEEVDHLRGEADLETALLSAISPEAAAEMYGQAPPDLSVMARARPGGASYIYTLLTGFYTDESGDVDNHLFPGIAMPDVMSYASAESAERAQIEGQLRDAASFLDWAADPTAEERRSLGRYVLAYLVLITILVYSLKRKIWGRLDKPGGG